MAKTTTLTDDMDGSPNAKERRYSIGDVQYAIDLTDDNYARFLELLSPWRSNSRVARNTRQNKAPVSSARDRAKIREWAESKGIKLAARGRFPNEVVRAYYESQPDIQEMSSTVGIKNGEPDYLDDEPLVLTNVTISSLSS